MLKLIRLDPKSAVQYHYWAQQSLSDRPLAKSLAKYMPERTYEGRGTIYVACAMVMNGESTHGGDSLSLTFKPEVLDSTAEFRLM